MMSLFELGYTPKKGISEQDAYFGVILKKAFLKNDFGKAFADFIVKTEPQLAFTLALISVGSYGSLQLRSGDRDLLSALKENKYTEFGDALTSDVFSCSFGSLLSRYCDSQYSKENLWATLMRAATGSYDADFVESIQTLKSADCECGNLGTFLNIWGKKLARNGYHILPYTSDEAFDSAVAYAFFGGYQEIINIGETLGVKQEKQKIHSAHELLEYFMEKNLLKRDVYENFRLAYNSIKDRVVDLKNAEDYREVIQNASFTSQSTGGSGYLPYLVDESFEYFILDFLYTQRAFGEWKQQIADILVSSEVEV